MTVTTTNRKSQFETNGVTVDFAFTFNVTNPSQVKALTIGDNGLEVDYDNFSVSISSSTSGGVLTTGDVLNDVQLVIYRVTGLTQEVDYINGGRFPADSHEGALDKLTQQNQEQQEELDRTLKSSIGTDQTITLGANLTDTKLLRLTGTAITSESLGVNVTSHGDVLSSNGDDIVSSGISVTELAESISNANTASDNANDAADNANSAAEEARDAIATVGGVDIGNYENNPTINLYNEYVVFQRSTTPTSWKAKSTTPLPYVINSATYPNPSLDPNLQQISSATFMLNEISWHGRVITNDIIVPSNMNAFSIGPSIKIDDNVNVSIGNNSNWRIL